MKPCAFLEMANDRKQVPGLGITVGTEHTHQAFGRLCGQPAQLLKADGGVDVIAQYRLAGVHVAGEQAFYPLLEQFRAEGRIRLDAGLNRFLGVLC